MKRIILILITFQLIGLFAQTGQIDVILQTKPIYIQKYIFPKDRNLFYPLPMEFSSSKLEKTYFDNTDVINVESVSLIYTTYKYTNTFIQQKLNKQRFQNLQNKLPHLFKDSSIKWLIYEQMESGDIKTTKNLFHGFVIQLKPKKTEREKEIYWMDSILNSAKDTNIILSLKQPCSINRKKNYTNKFYPKSARKRRKGKLYKKSGIWNRHEKYTIIKDTLCPPDKIVTFKSKHYHSLHFHDSAVFKVLRRKENAWQNSIIVQDVTGSMSPYMMQTLVWLNLATAVKKPNKFVFFNDGDNKANAIKKVGNIGGLYTINSSKADAIQAIMTKAALKGSGGDGPENDLEAIIKAQNKFPKSKDIVLIADNQSGVKDINLLWKVKKPIHVVLCGYQGYVHPDYLLIARQTGGTIHTIEKDITNLSNLSEGSVFTIGNMTYTIKQGNIFRIKSTKL